MDKKYDFIAIDERPVMTPMNQLFCKRIMDSFYREFNDTIRKDCCYENSLIAAEWLISKGFDIEVVEGYYQCNDYDKKIAMAFGAPINPENYMPTEHRFLKKGDKYFDPTLEMLWHRDFEGGMSDKYLRSHGFSNPSLTKCYDYQAKRIFSFGTISEFTQDAQEYYGLDCLFSTLTGGAVDSVSGEKMYLGRIDENGKWDIPEIHPVIELYNRYCHVAG